MPQKPNDTPRPHVDECSPSSSNGGSVEEYFAHYPVVTSEQIAQQTPKQRQARKRSRLQVVPIDCPSSYRTS